jgi:Protein of unknown function (DUF3052)
VEPLPEGVEIIDAEVYTMQKPARTGIPAGASPSGVASTCEIDVIHIFTNTRDGLFRGLSDARNLIKQNGSIWISWYKKAAKLPTEITEDTIREAAFPLGLVDVKVCAVDEKWSGLKLVIRKENRI